MESPDRFYRKKVAQPIFGVERWHISVRLAS
jgi:hypothetical protein